MGKHTIVTSAAHATTESSTTSTILVSVIVIHHNQLSLLFVQLLSCSFLFDLCRLDVWRMLSNEKKVRVFFSFRLDEIFSFCVPRLMSCPNPLNQPISTDFSWSKLIEVWAVLATYRPRWMLNHSGSELPQIYPKQPSFGRTKLFPNRLATTGRLHGWKRKSFMTVKYHWKMKEN